MSNVDYTAAPPRQPVFTDQGGVARPASQSYPLAVGSGVTSQARNRNIAAAATSWANATNTVTWTSGIYEVTVTVNLAAAASVTGALIVFDAPNDATASAWLSDAGSQSSDVQYAVVLNAQRQTFLLSAPITRLDVLALGAACRILVEAN